MHRGPCRLLALLTAGAAGIVVLGCEPGIPSSIELAPTKARAAAAGTVSVAAAAPDLADAAFAEGVVVWESARSGAWRIWTRSLEGGAARQLSADEAGRQHCCAHLAPDGRSLVYLSLPDGQERYPADSAQGELRLLTLDGATPSAGASRILATRVLAKRARTYFEHRAAVWRDDRTLLYIDGEGRTVELALDGGQTQTLTPPTERHGWLLDPTLRWATTGTPTFSPYDAAGGRVLDRPTLGGCQPYFTADGKFGYWIAGSGGPIRAIDLASRQETEVVRKADPRLPADRGYLYFPMVARSGNALVWGASNGDHDHLRADYDIFAAPLDPATFQLAGPVRRVTADPGSDRFPDVHVERLLVALAPSVQPPPATAVATTGAATPGEVLAWRGARRPNLVRTQGGQEISTIFEPKGRAFWDAGFGAELRGGSLLADMGTMDRLLNGVKTTNELSLELIFAADDSAGASTLLHFGDGRRQNNLRIGLRGETLQIQILTESNAPAGTAPTLEVGGVRAGQRHHLALTYAPGRLAAYLDGRPAAESRDWREGFFHWQQLPLVLGNDWPGQAPFRGKIHQLVVRDRAAGAAEVAAWAQAATAEPEALAPALRVQAELIAVSPPPTLEQIAPYREALAVYEYRVVAAEGAGAPAPGATIRVVHRVLADGAVLPIAGLRPGARLELVLAPFRDQPQLESLYLSNRLPPAPGRELLFSAAVEP